MTNGGSGRALGYMWINVHVKGQKGRGMTPEERAERIADDLADNVIVESQLADVIALAITAAVEAERDACAKICDGLFWRERRPVEYQAAWRRGLELAEQAIRARANVSKSDPKIDTSPRHVDGVPKTCAGCRWWDQKGFDLAKDCDCNIDENERPDWAYCKRMEEGEQYNGSNAAAIGCGACHGETQVITAPDFGCNQWEGK